MWRADFPIFEQNPETVFLDSAASAQKPQQVLAAMEVAQTQHYANIHRGLYAFSQKSTQTYEDARTKIANFMHARRDDIIFTRNATESINLVAQTWGRTHLKAGDEIVLTQLEHHANIVPWQILAAEIGVTIKVADIEADGSLPADNITREITDKTKLIAFTGLSNALGTVVDVPAVLQAAHNKGITTLVDASQAIVHGGVDVQQWSADFVVWTGHKLYGPTGVGILYAKKELMDTLPPYQGGGDMIDTVSFSGTTYADSPARFEAGTPNIVGVIGLGAAVDYVQSQDMSAAQKYETELLALMKDELAKIPQVQMITPHNQAAVLSFTLANINTHDAAILLDECGIACRTGHHCAMPLMERLGTPGGTIRASIAPYNTAEDIHKLASALKKVVKLLG